MCMMTVVPEDELSGAINIIRYGYPPSLYFAFLPLQRNIGLAERILTAILTLVRNAGAVILHMWSNGVATLGTDYASQTLLEADLSLILGSLA